MINNHYNYIALITLQCYHNDINISYPIKARRRLPGKQAA